MGGTPGSISSPPPVPNPLSLPHKLPTPKVDKPAEIVSSSTFDVGSLFVVVNYLTRQRPRLSHSLRHALCLARLWVKTFVFTSLAGTGGWGGGVCGWGKCGGKTRSHSPCQVFWGAASARTRTDRHSGQLVLSGQHQAAPVAVHHTLTTTSLPLPRLLGRVFVSSTTTTTPSAAPCKPHCHKAVQKLHHNKDLVSAGWMLDAGCCAGCWDLLRPTFSPTSCVSSSMLPPLTPSLTRSARQPVL